MSTGRRTVRLVIQLLTDRVQPANVSVSSSPVP